MFGEEGEIFFFGAHFTKVLEEQTEFVMLCTRNYVWPLKSIIRKRKPGFDDLKLFMD